MTDPAAGEQRSRLTLLTVHAHPDDEASKGAPTLARYHAEGVHTVLVCCTGGEEGDLQNPTLREPGQPFHGLTPEEEKAKVVAMRPAELAESARIIGFDEVVMLGYRDSGMPDTPPNEHPDSFHQADLDEATGRLVAVIRRTRPQVILTYGDDQRVYPHPDHLQGARHLAAGVRPGRRPRLVPRARRAVPAVEAVLLDVVAGPDARRSTSACSRATASRRSTRSGSSGPDQDHRITTRVEVGDFQFARSESLRAHATQVDPTESWWFGLDDAELADVYPWEDWILARSLVGADPRRGDSRTTSSPACARPSRASRP